MNGTDVYLVTGGAGFIGSALIRKLIRETQASVVNLDKLTYAGNLDSLASVSDSSRYAFRRADICDAGAVRTILEEFRPTAVIHLAAESHVDRSIDGPSAFIQTNLNGTFTLLEESRHYWSQLQEAGRRDFRFLHVSTDEVFGSLGDHGYFTEETPYRPNSPYSATKAGSDHLVRAWHHTYGLPSLTSNCSNNYGPFQFPEKLIPLMLLNALAGKRLPVYGAGDNVRDWLYVDDHADALIALLRSGRPGESYAVGGSNEMTNLEVVHRICDLVDELAPDLSVARRDLIELVADRPGHDKRYAIDASRMKSEIGWRPTESFDSGLRKTVRWYLDNREWWERVRSGAYRGERLGLAAAAGGQ